MKTEAERIEAIKAKKQFMPTLCWKCIHAVPDDALGTGCSWSRELKPVEGWNAFQANTEEDSYYPPSRPVYHVLYCPQFVEQTKTPPMQTAQEKNVRGLALAVIRRAADDLADKYGEYYRRKQHNVTRMQLYGYHGYQNLYGHRTSEEEFDFLAKEIKAIRKDMMGEWMNTLSDINTKALYYDILKKVREDYHKQVWKEMM